MRRHAIRRILQRAAVVTAALLATTAAIGFVLQQRRDARITVEQPAPGEFVDVGDHQLHYRLRGSGPVTFVLEAGAGENSGSWGGIESQLPRLASFGLSFVMFESGDPVKNRSGHLRAYGAELRAFMGFERGDESSARARIDAALRDIEVLEPVSSTDAPDGREP